MDWTPFKAALFDLDGVITPTAQVHMTAWGEMFNAFLTARNVDQPYTDSDYFAYVDGKPRYDGVRSFLTSRNITLPEGDPSDDPSQETICGLGNRKNLAFNQVLARDGVAAYPGTLELMDHLDSLSVPMAVVSSSQNAPAVLKAAGLSDRFVTVVDGAVARDLGLPGKPAPDTFVHAAQALNVPVAQAVVLEDAESGVAAGRAGDFGLVVGVDRGAGRDRLLASGAGVVVADCKELVR